MSSEPPSQSDTGGESPADAPASKAPGPEGEGAVLAISSPSHEPDDAGLVARREDQLLVQLAAQRIVDHVACVHRVHMPPHADREHAVESTLAAAIPDPPFMAELDD